MGIRPGGVRSGPAPGRRRRGARRRRRVCGCPSSQGHPQAVAEPDKAVAHSGLDGGEGGAEAFGDLAVGEAAVVREQDRLPLDAGEGSQAAAYGLVLQPGGDLRDYLVERDARGAGAALAVGGGLFGAYAVNSAVVRDGEDPADRRATLRVEARGGAPHLDEGVLGDLLGERRIARDATDQTIRTRGDRVVEGGESVLVAGGDALHDVIEVRWSWLLRALPRPFLQRCH